MTIYGIHIIHEKIESIRLDLVNQNYNKQQVINSSSDTSQLILSNESLNIEIIVQSFDCPLIFFLFCFYF